jgi:hypothetical protein
MPSDRATDCDVRPDDTDDYAYNEPDYQRCNYPDHHPTSLTPGMGLAD